MPTHRAVATVAIRAPLAIIEVDTIDPIDREVLVRVEWIASTPLDLHQNDGGLLVKHPQILGDSAAGTVVKVGPKVQNLAVGDKVGSPSTTLVLEYRLLKFKVFGFCFVEPKNKGCQEYITVPETFLGKVIMILDSLFN